MAELVIIRNSQLLLRLTPLEKFGALHGDIQVPLSSVRAVSTQTVPWESVRGIRAPGTGWPGVIMLGTTRGSFGKDFAAVYRRRPAVLVELDGQKFQHLLVCTADPEHDVEVLRERLRQKT